MTRQEILDMAIKTVCNSREEEYGTPEDNFSLIADFWTTYLNREISSVDVAIMINLLKGEIMFSINVKPLTSEQIKELKKMALTGAVAFGIGYFIGHRGKIYTYLNLNNVISVLASLIH